MAAVFKNTEFAFGGAFPANKGIINAIGGKLTGTMMQNLDVQYRQQVQRIYELGISQQTTKVYFVGAKPQGNISAGHIMGPGVAMKAYFEAYGDVCQANTNTIEVNLAGQICLPGGQGALVDLGQCSMRAGMCYLTSVGFSTNVSNMVINVGSTLEFTNLDYTGV